MKRILGICVVVFMLFFQVNASAVEKINPAEVLSQAATEINHALHEMHESLEVAVDELQVVGITGEAATAALNKLFAANEYAFDCATIDTKGVLVDVVPKEDAKYIGVDISHQEHVMKVLETHKPAVSTEINTAEGFVGFDLVHPLFDKSGEFIGSVSILTKSHFFGRIIDQHVDAQGFEIWMMQKNGRTIYDVNDEEIGLNLFEDELYAPYKSLLAAGHDVIRSREGKSSYVFLDKSLEKEVSKNLLWTTIELHGTEFRLALAYIPVQGE